jgi:hypothetical protein
MYRLCASQSIMYYVLAPALFSTLVRLLRVVAVVTSPSATFLTDLERRPHVLAALRAHPSDPPRGPRRADGEAPSTMPARCTNSEQYSDWLTITPLS